MMISTLSLMLKKREASYEQLFEKYESFCAIVGKCDPDYWALKLIKSLIEKVESDEGFRNCEEVESLKWLIWRLEESLSKMESSLRHDSVWESQAEVEIKKLHLELASMVTLNNHLKDKVDWYEVRSSELEYRLKKGQRRNELNKQRVFELHEKIEELTVQVNCKQPNKTKKKKRNSTCSKANDFEPNQSISTQTVDNEKSPGILSSLDTEIINLKNVLTEESNKSKQLKLQFDKLNADFSTTIKEKEDLENKVKSMTVLKKSLIKLAIKHKKAVEYKNENIRKLNETIIQLNHFLKIAGINFIKQ